MIFENTKDIFKDFKNVELKSPIFGLLLVVIVLPFKMILSSIAVFIYTFLIIINSKTIRFSDAMRERKVVLIPLIYFMFILFGIFYSPSLTQGFSRITTQLGLFIFPVLITLSSFKLFHIDLLKKIFLYSVIVFCCFSIITLLINLIIHFDQKHHYNFIQRSMYHFHFPYDCLYINFSYVLLLFGPYHKLFKKIISILFFIVITLFGVRMGMFSFLIISVFYISVNYKKTLNIKNLLFISLLVGMSFLLLKTSKYASDKFYDTLENIGFNVENQVSDIGKKYHKIEIRKVIWASSVELIKEKPIFGYGTANHQEILNDIYTKKGCTKCMNKNSHNQYLTTSLNHGLLGLAALILIFVISVTIAIKLKSSEFALFLLLILISSLTESILLRQKGIMFFSIFLSIFLTEYTLKRSRFI